MALDTKVIERELDNLERSITLLKREYEIYFAGASKLPPNDQRNKLEKTIKRMGITQDLTYAMRFRYNSILARFNSYLDLWNKQMRIKEEGRSPVRVGGISSEMKQRLMGQTLKPEPKEEEEHPAKPQSKEAPESLQKIYRDYVRARQDVGEGAPNMTLEGFAQVISKQKDAIIQKLHCKDVEFYVTVEQGHTKLKARPVK